jgi:hypothetical protein
VAVEEQNPYHYSGVHAFGFLEGADGPPETVMDAVRDLGAPPEGPVLWAGAFVGDYAGLVHVRVEDGALGELQRLISGELHDRGFRGRWAIEVRPAKQQAGGNVALFVGVKRGTQEVIAISALRVQPGKLDAVLADAQRISTFRGASVVFGKADVLLQLGAPDLATVATSVETEVQAIAGITASATSFCDGTR